MSQSIAWMTVLDSTDRGPRSTLTNAVRVLQMDPLWSAERLWYDEFLDCIFLANERWREEDDYKLTVYMQEVAGMTTVADHLVSKAVRMVAKQRSRHVVRDWLTTLQWDGEPRIAHAFEDYWGADRQPADYVRAASQNFFIGLAARVLHPGCKLDTMPVFEGKQGIRKSSALDVLGGAWYAVINEAVSTKDFLQSLRGKWLLEISELQSFNRADIAHVKSMMSTRTDHYRPSYGRNTVEFPRQCAFAGTTNADDWGYDETGLRRFWPITCGEINIAALAAVREQLFAEAVAQQRTGLTWWEMPGSTSDQQADRQSQHPWTESVLAFVALKDEVTVTEVLVQGLKKDLDTLSMPDNHAIGRILSLSGWEKHTMRRHGRQLKVWQRVKDLTLSEETATAFV